MYNSTRLNPAPFFIHTLATLLIGLMTLPLMAQREMPTPGVQYNLVITRGASGMLSCAGPKVDLWGKDDNSGRQKWSFKPVGGGLYQIFVYYTEGGRRMLSSGHEGYVDLWHTDDNSGRQKWRLIPLGNNKYNIMVAGGTHGGRKYLSTNGSGKVDLWVRDDNSGRQQWTLLPENIKLEDVKFDLSRMTKFAKPSFVTTSTNRNNSDGSSNVTFTFEGKAMESSSFQREHGFTFTVGTEMDVKVPGIGGGNVKTEASTTNTWTYGKESAREDTRSYSVEHEVLGRTEVTIKAIVKMYQLNIPYTAIGTSPVTGKKITCSGVWRGVSAGEIKYDIQQRNLPGYQKESAPNASTASPMLQGNYIANSPQNDWHYGQFNMSSMTWTNRAGVSWGLERTPISQTAYEVVYRTDRRNPYYDSGYTTMTFALENGRVTGFQFAEGFYRKQE